MRNDIALIIHEDALRINGRFCDVFAEALKKINISNIYILAGAELATAREEWAKRKSRPLLAQHDDLIATLDALKTVLNSKKYTIHAPVTAADVVYGKGPGSAYVELFARLARKELPIAETEQHFDSLTAVSLRSNKGLASTTVAYKYLARNLPSAVTHCIYLDSDLDRLKELSKIAFFESTQTLDAIFVSETTGKTVDNLLKALSVIDYKTFRQQLLKLRTSYPDLASDIIKILDVTYLVVFAASSSNADVCAILDIFPKVQALLKPGVTYDSLSVYQEMCEGLAKTEWRAIAIALRALGKKVAEQVGLDSTGFEEEPIAARKKITTASSSALFERKTNYGAIPTEEHSEKSATVSKPSLRRGYSLLGS